MLLTVLRISTDLTKRWLCNRGNLANKCLYSVDKIGKYRNNRRESLLALNYHLEHVDNTVPEAVVKHPGLSYNDYDSRGQPQTWMLMKLFESIRLFAHHYPLDDTGRTFRDYEQMTRDCLMFLLTSEFVLSKDIYRPSQITPWMKTSIKGGYVGKTSLNSSTEMRCENSEQIIASNINHLVCVDKQSRRPLALPAWWREKYSESGKKHEPLKINKFKIPDKTSIYHTNVSWSDTDLNLHTNWTSYVRFAVDAAHHCHQNGALQNFEDNFANGIHKVQIYYYGESIQGDKLALHVWEDKTDHRLLMVDIFNKGQSICQIKLFFH